MVPPGSAGYRESKGYEPHITALMCARDRLRLAVLVVEEVGFPVCVKVGTNGTLVIQATMRSTGVGPGVSGSTYAMSSTDEGKTWACGTNATSGNNIGSRYLKKHMTNLC